MKALTLTVITFLFLITGFAQDFDSERLPIGDINRKYDFCKVSLDKIFDTNAGKETSLNEMINKLKDYRIVLVGESHTNQLYHDVELNVIKGLYEAGKPVVLALEMYNPKQDEALAKWVSGTTDPNTFMEQTDFLTTWGHNYRYYKAIFDYAREKHIPMYGANIDKDYASKIGRGGVASLTAEDLKVIPQLDTTNIEHKFLIKVMMDGMDATMPAMFNNNMYPAQSLWDAAMGEGAIRVAKEHPEATVVLLAGSGHVVYNLGIAKIIKDRSNFSFASVVPVDIHEKAKDKSMMHIVKDLKKEKDTKTDDSVQDKPDLNIQKPSEDKVAEKEKPSNPHTMMMDDSPNKIVIKSYADFIWGVKEMKQELYPAFGFGIKDEPQNGGYLVSSVLPNTIAFNNGLKKNDIILSIDGKTFENATALRKHLQFKNWDEQILFSLLRGDNKVELSFTIEPVNNDE